MAQKRTNAIPIQVEPMGRHDLLVAYPLMRLKTPSMTPGDWMRTARILTRENENPTQGGLLARYEGARAPCGLAIYRRETKRGGKTRLIVNSIIVATCGASWPVVHAIAAESVRVAARLGCVETEYHIAAQDMAMAFEFHAAGIADEIVVLQKNHKPMEQPFS
ncbi:hypothetical protein [Acetobacter nitrogenifigens]|uniref:Uncharacterized protein n=1 Tax=Acetobacter nitrogenifigens DSM 23921 = NBRC 105050 TaxID=1120919 RepID=A0A511X951_9PROT|nr:hypothetical protein [Acetobacter nitrogenifigens]GEN59473.1 hypothetical protein ANI02nite_13570 [Acetobacter nitrogenifigens DSM 23921 = NBRC 105050]